MLKREDFMFTIGYDGEKAVVDGQAKRAYGRLSTEELCTKGLFRAAWCSALRSGSHSEREQVARAWNKAAGTDYSPDFPFERLFGVYPVEVHKVKVL